MVQPVKHYWFRIHYSGKCDPDTLIYTGTSLQSVLDRIEQAQAGRLRYQPNGPRIVRIAALTPPECEPNFQAFLDECLRLANNTHRAAI